MLILCNAIVCYSNFLLVMFFAAMIRHCALAISADNDMTPDYFLTWRMTESHVEMVEC
jgi:hypothetical protein